MSFPSLVPSVFIPGRPYSLSRKSLSSLFLSLKFPSPDFSISGSRSSPYLSVRPFPLPPSLPPSTRSIPCPTFVPTSAVLSIPCHTFVPTSAVRLHPTPTFVPTPAVRSVPTPVAWSLPLGPSLSLCEGRHRRPSSPAGGHTRGRAAGGWKRKNNGDWRTEWLQQYLNVGRLNPARQEEVSSSADPRLPWHAPLKTSQCLHARLLHAHSLLHPAHAALLPVFSYSRFT